jgi:uncharacterized protein YajQ (UPF0234 family)
MKLIPIFSLALLFGGANLNAHHKDGCPMASMEEEHHCGHHHHKHLHHLKKKVLKHILMNNGVSEEATHKILEDLHELKMKIKHKIKRVLKHALHEAEEGHHKCAHHLKKMALKKILARHGVEGEQAHQIIRELKELKMKIKHKVKRVLKEIAEE